VLCPVNPSPFEIKRLFELLGPIVLGKLLTSKAVATAQTTVAHGLGRIPKGWFEVSPLNGGASVKQSASPDETNLYLIASSAVAAATIWVF
jgi:hypothetical protein